MKEQPSRLDIKGTQRYIDAQELAAAPHLNEELIHAIGKVARLNSMPLRDGLSNKYGFMPPNSDGLKRYIEGGIRRSFRNKRATGPNGEFVLAKKIERARSAIIKDVENVTWLHTAIAAKRLRALGGVLTAIELDSHDANRLDIIYSIDAIEDYGFSLLAEKGLSLRINKDINIGASVIKLSRDMQENKASIYQYPELVDIVHVEQVKRKQFWGSRHGVVVDLYGRIPDEN